MPIRVDAIQPSVHILILSLIVIVIAIVGHLARVPYLTPYHFWVAVLAYAVLMAGTLYKI
ncbi:MAG: hypothetical protein HY659_04995 [Rhizobiales bacterium]|nr:hypothetical protein [Hyphomicrobiales bacterium]